MVDRFEEMAERVRLDLELYGVRQSIDGRRRVIAEALRAAYERGAEEAYEQGRRDALRGVQGACLYEMGKLELLPMEYGGPHRADDRRARHELEHGVAVTAGKETEMEEELRSLLLVRFEHPRLAYEWDGRPHRWVTVPAHGHTPFIRGERGPIDIRPGDYIVVEGDKPVDVISRDAVGEEYLPATRIVQTRNVETVYPTFDRAEHIPDRYSVWELKLIQGDLGQARSRGIIFVGEGRR